MGVYVGVNGVKRDVTGIDVGVSGIVRHAPCGYCGVNGSARSFLDMVDQIQWIEFRIERLQSATVGSDYNFSNREDIPKSECSSYGSYSVSDSTLSVYSENIGKGLLVSVADYAIFKDGCEKRHILGTLKEQGKSVSISLNGYLGGHYYGSSNFYGAYSIYYFNESIYSGSFDGSVSFSKTYGNSAIDTSYYAFFIGAGEVSGDGYQTTRVTINSLTADGVSIPYKFMDTL